MLNQKTIKADFCVVGAGIAGICAAVAAARHGVKTVLMHERPVLGGNASSEIRMWVCGAQGEDNRETGILEEIALENLYRNPNKNWHIWDTVLYETVKKEENITLLLNCTCMDAETETGEFAFGRSTRIKSITGYSMTTQTMIKVEADYYSDCSGDSILAPLTGAKFRIGRECAEEFGENTHVKESDKMTMGNSCLIQGRETTREVKYTHPDSFKKFTDKDFEFRQINMDSTWENFWYLELGGNRDTIGDAEDIACELRELALGTWDYVKNSGKYDVKNWDLDFLGFLPGKRESRRMVGEYIITERDVNTCKNYEDTVAYGGWPIDDHFPMGFYHRSTANTNFHTPAPYPLPYRALYSKNVDNLYFAGRNISMTHMAMSSIRIMATCSLLGHAVGKAAAVAVKYNATPHDVYLSHLQELQELLLNEDSFLPSKQRKISPKCMKANLNAGANMLRNGQDRAHCIYNTDETNYAYFAESGEEITYSFEAGYVDSVHIVFCSDLNRDTLPGSACERRHVMRANQRADSPVMCMPKTLCKEFVLYGELNGNRSEILQITNNRKRSYHIPINSVFDKLVLVPLDIWSDNAKIPVISFDFI